jgi:CheY-like chemotaxis protein
MTRSNTILVVDDEDNDAILIKRALSKAQIRTGLQRVRDGEEALRYLKREGEFNDAEGHPFPSVVILDLKMPRRNGFEVLTWIRQNERTRLLPVVVFTSSREKEDINRAYELGANAYMVKPNSFDDLVEVVKSIYTYWLQLCTPPEMLGSKKK